MKDWPCVIIEEFRWHTDMEYWRLSVFVIALGALYGFLSKNSTFGACHHTCLLRLS